MHNQQIFIKRLLEYTFPRGRANNPGMDTPTIHAHHLEGFKYLKTIFPLLQRLHRHGCERDQGQKRLLHYEQYAALVLLYFFNPIVTSLRGLQHPARRTDD